MPYRLSCMPYAYETDYIFSGEYEWSDQDALVNAAKVVHDEINTDPESTPHIVLSQVSKWQVITAAWMWCPAVSEFRRFF